MKQTKQAASKQKMTSSIEQTHEPKRTNSTGTSAKGVNMRQSKQAGTGQKKRSVETKNHLRRKFTIEFNRINKNSLNGRNDFLKFIKAKRQAFYAILSNDDLCMQSNRQAVVKPVKVIRLKSDIQTIQRHRSDIVVSNFILTEIDNNLLHYADYLYDRKVNMEVVNRIDSQKLLQIKIDLTNDKPVLNNTTEFSKVRKVDGIIKRREQALSMYKKLNRQSKLDLYNSRIDLIDRQLVTLSIICDKLIAQAEIVDGFSFVSLERFEDKQAEYNFLLTANSLDIANRYYLSVS